MWKHTGTGITQEEREANSRNNIEELIKVQELDMTVDEFIDKYSSNRGVNKRATNVWRNCEKYQFMLKGNKKYLLNVLNDSLNFLVENPKFNQSEYIKEYTKENYKHYHLMVNKKDEDVINKIEEQKSKNKYLIDLVRKDIENE